MEFNRDQEIIQKVANIWNTMRPIENLMDLKAIQNTPALKKAFWDTYMVLIHYIQDQDQ